MKNVYVKTITVTPLGGIGGSQICGVKTNLTGSSFLIDMVYNDSSTKKILLDFGMHQGSEELEKANREIPFDPKNIDAVLLTHAHIDHCGRIPMLFKQGYKGMLYVPNKSTGKIAFLQCQNSAKLMDSKFNSELARAKSAYNQVKKAQKLLEGGKDKKGNKTTKTLTEQERAQAKEVLSKYGDITSETLKPQRAIYDEDDVNSIMIHTTRIEDIMEIIPCLKVKVVNAAHTLGSSSIILTFQKKHNVKRIVFSGDLGEDKRTHSPHGKAEVDNTISVDCVICESTYGGQKRDSKYYDIGLEKFISDIKKDLSRGKTVFVPAFAYDRSQEVIYHLNQNGIVPYLDGELAKTITEVYKTDCEVYKNLEYMTISTDERDGVLSKPGAKIIVTTSGMMEGGPIISYVEKYIENPQSSFYLTGYCSPGTLGSKLANGDKKISVYAYDCRCGKQVKIEKTVKAKIITTSFMSGHADESTLLRWLNDWKYKKGAKVYLNHGDINGSSLALKNSIERRAETGRFNPDVKVSVLDYDMQIVLWIIKLLESFLGLFFKLSPKF